jgi:hypothetical protein
MFTKMEIRSFINSALQTDEPPAYESKTEVRVTGEAPHKPIYWTGRRWCVSSIGIERRDGTYAIAKSRIFEEEDTHGWVRHMLESKDEDWTDLADFVEALRLARKRWPTPQIRTGYR